MDLRRIAEAALVASRVASRVGQTYRLNHNRLKAMGVSSEDIGRVERTVREIEQFADDALNALGQTVRETP